MANLVISSYSSRLRRKAAGEVTVAVGEQRALERESPLALTLAQGVSRGNRMDLVVQKATELGVSCIAPLLTERSVVRLDPQQAARKVAHWRGIAIAACEQSGRNRVPQVATPLAGVRERRECRRAPAALPRRGTATGRYPATRHGGRSTHWPGGGAQ